MPRPGTTTQRGYGAEHQAERERWRPTVEAGQATCHATRCLERTRAIAPDAEWHLGHNPERTRWTGPEHARCNTSEGGRRRGQPRRPARPAPIPAIEADEW